jgi:hypothetical protein
MKYIQKLIHFIFRIIDPEQNEIYSLKKRIEARYKFNKKQKETK